MRRSILLLAAISLAAEASAEPVRFAGRSVVPDEALALPDRGASFYVFTDKALTRDQVALAAEQGLRYLGVVERKTYAFLRETKTAEQLTWLAEQENVIGTAAVAPLDRVDAEVLAYVGPVERLPQPLWFAVLPRTTTAELRTLASDAALERLRLPTDENAPLLEESIVILDRAASTPEALDRLMRSPFVGAIGFEHERVLHNGAARIAANAIDLDGMPYALDGTGVVVGHWDGGQVDDDHPDFEGRVTNWERGEISSHATHTAGTILGGGVLDSRHRGFAPGATMVAFQFYGNPTGERRAAKHEFYHEHDNHSWGSSSNNFGGYNQVAFELDLDARDLLLVPVKSAGNDGQQSEIVDQRYGFDSLSSDSTSKNSLVVGATRDDGDLAGFSSRGPTNDGRVKPDLCANGSQLTSTYPGNRYGATSGTSMSAPAVTGMIALLSQLYKRNNEGRRWAPDMIRGIMIHTAVDVFHPGPDYRHGWGNADALAAANLILADAETPGRRLVRGAVRDGEAKTYSLTVPAGAPELKVTLSWLDAFMNSAAERRLLNDIDLILRSPSGETFRPFVLDPANPFDDAVPGTNTLDNVEQVVVRNPEPGEWGVWVGASSITDPDLFVQGFVLVSDFPVDRTFERVTIDTSNGELPIPDGSVDGLSIPFDVTSRGEIESLRVYLDIKHAARGHLRVELISPSGTMAVLETEDQSTRRDIYAIYPDLRSYDEDTLGFTGEYAEGRWIVRISDVTAGESGAVRQAAIEVDIDAETLVPPNPSPIADAGPDVTVLAGALVQLDGSASSDPEGEPLTYSWTLTMGEATLEDANTARPTFIAPAVTEQTSLVARLTVSDGTTSADDEVTIVVEPEGTVGVNQSPVANAGESRTVGVGSDVVLDGSASSDPDGDPLVYTWAQLGGDDIPLDGTNTVAARFKAPAVDAMTTFTFRLEVSDGRGGVDIADVTIGVDPGVETVDETKLLETEEGCGCTTSGQGRGGWSLLGLLFVFLMGQEFLTRRDRRRRQR